MIIALFVLSFLAVIALPIVVAHQINKSYQTGWGLFGIGAVTFVAAQVLHIPFNLFVQSRDWFPSDTAVFTNLLIVALFLGFSAGFFEEGARYLTYRFWAKRARSWKDGMMLGAGHGGIEAILLVGIVGLLNVLFFAAWQNGAFQNVVPADQMGQFQEQVDALYATPWYLVPLGFVERVFAICFHLSASLLVMQVFIRKQFRWWWAAVVLHAFLNGMVIVVLGLTAERFGENSALIVEGALGLFTLLPLWIIFKLKDSELLQPDSEPLPELAQVQLNDLDLDNDALEKSKYS